MDFTNVKLKRAYWAYGNGSKLMKTMAHIKITDLNSRSLASTDPLIANELHSSAELSGLLWLSLLSVSSDCSSVPAA